MICKVTLKHLVTRNRRNNLRVKGFREKEGEEIISFLGELFMETVRSGSNKEIKIDTAYKIRNSFRKIQIY